MVLTTICKSRLNGVRQVEAKNEILKGFLEALIQSKKVYTVVGSTSSDHILILPSGEQISMAEGASAYYAEAKSVYEGYDEKQ